jgi:hypothetical protein
VVLPLVTVFLVVSFFSIQDRLRERRTPASQPRNGSPPASTNALEPVIRQIPQRRISAAPPISPENIRPEPGALAESPTPEDNAAEDESASTVAPVVAGTLPTPDGLGIQPGGAIAGRVVLLGVPPPERDLPLDPSCARLRTGRLTTRFFLVGERGGLGDVVVALTPDLNGPPIVSPIAPMALPPVVLDQVGCEFIPYVLAVQAGQRLVVRNSDPVLHNVHLLPNSTVTGNKEVNRAHLAGGPDFVLTFEAPEAFLRIKCDVHPWMFAYVSIFDHTYFAVTPPNGTFQLSNVPPGDYVLEATHRTLGTLTKPVTVSVRETSRIDFEFAVQSGTPP